MRKVEILLLIAALGSWVHAYDFKVANEDGFDLCYKIQKVGNVVSLVCENNIDSLNYRYFTCDTIRVQGQVEYNGNTYIVRGIGQKAFKGTHCRYVYFPSSYYQGGYSITGFTSGSDIEGIIVDENHPYYSTIDGILCSKTGKTLIHYPSAKPDESYMLPEGIDSIGPMSLYENRALRILEMPLTLKSVRFNAFATEFLEEVICKDSLEEIEGGVFTNLPNLRRIVLGNSLKQFHCGSLAHFQPITIECRTTLPPSCMIDTFVLGSKYVGSSLLYVPRKSVNLYQQAEGWKLFGNILPIEPPIVTGVDTAEVSWVQNFSATGYVWTLYTDEAKTQRFMSLTFDANGHLTHIDINSGHLPARMPALYSENGEEERRFAEYYSFTISGLSPDTRYYYTRQSLNGTEIIDEETGSFETLSNEMTGLNPCTGFSSDPQKIIKDGSVYILHQEKKYSLDGNCINR